MENVSKKYTKLLIFILIGIVLLSIGVNLLMRFTSLGEISSIRSGAFANTSQGIDNDGLYFYADEANGHSIFFANLNQEALDKFSLLSRISSGEMILVMKQDNIEKKLDLSESSIEVSANDMDLSMFIPGRIEIQLFFINAEVVNVAIGWR